MDSIPKKEREKALEIHKGRDITSEKFQGKDRQEPR